MSEPPITKEFVQNHVTDDLLWLLKKRRWLFAFFVFNVVASIAHIVIVNWWGLINIACAVHVWHVIKDFSRDIRECLYILTELAKLDEIVDEKKNPAEAGR